MCCSFKLAINATLRAFKLLILPYLISICTASGLLMMLALTYNAPVMFDFSGEFLSS